MDLSGTIIDTSDRELSVHIIWGKCTYFILYKILNLIRPFFCMRHVKTHFFVVVEKYESSLATENKELYLTI